MGNCIIGGADVHDSSITLQVAADKEAPEQMRYATNEDALNRMIAMLHNRARQVGAKRIVFIYEASGTGFGLYDKLRAAGIECHVVAPTKLARSWHERKHKSDPVDAMLLLNLARGYVLAGNELPLVWVPDWQLRADREIVRGRLEVGTQVTKIKTQIRCLLKRNGIKIEGSKSWGKGFALRLSQFCENENQPFGVRSALASLVRRLTWLQEDVVRLDKDMLILSRQTRYTLMCEELRKEIGVGWLVAMVFITEMGDMTRFANRKDIGCYLGLVPGSNDTGETKRAGHITCQGSSRVRAVLCQAAWTRIRLHPGEKAAYLRICARNPKYRKIGVVALMRRLAVQMWHIAVTVQRKQKAAA